MSVPTVNARASSERSELKSHPARLGAYRLYERLGAGGHATVFRARRIGEPTAPDVALKRLHPHLCDTDYAVAGFGREARISCLLDHPVIRRVHTLRRDQEELYMIMEYVEGVSLDVVLRRARALGNRLPLAGVLAVLQRLCDALHHAHELVDERGRPVGFVHRDISPSNLIVTPDGQLKLIDLGVVALQVADATRSGLIKGKYAYMAPEVMRKAPFDRRADVFSVGVVAWELIATRRLYKANQLASDAVAVRSQPVAPPSRFNRACPPELDAVVLRALAGDPDERWHSCAVIAVELRRIALELGMPPGEAAIAELAAESPPSAEEELETVPRLAQPRPRLARGTTSPTVVPGRAAKPRPAGARLETERVGAAPRLRAGPGRRGMLRTLVGSLATTLAVTLVGSALLASTQPAMAPADAAVDATADAVVAGADAALADAAPADAAPADAEPLPLAEPLEVDESALTRVLDRPPRSRSTDAGYRARLCIDAEGAVSSVAVLEGPERLHPRITRALLRWRYQPYQEDGVARAVCFDLSSRIQKVTRGDRR